MPALKYLLSFSLLALAATQVQAAPITWGPATDVSAETDVSTNGTLVEAVNASARTSFSDHTVNGVKFVGGSLLPQGGFNGDFDPNAASELSGTYQQLLNDCDFGGGTTTTIEIGGSNLISGLPYEVQVWFLDTRNTSPRVMTYSDESADAAEVGLDGRAGQFAIGTFVADGTSQTLKIGSNVGNAHLNAFQVRSLSAPLEVTTLEDEFDTPSGEDLSLREAIRDAGAAGLVNFDNFLDGGRIELDAQKGQLVIDKSLAIDASTLPNGIIIDGGSNGDLIHNSESETRCLLIRDANNDTVLNITLNRLTVQNGFPSEGKGANINNHENLTLNDCRILNGTTPNRSEGGGISNADGELTINRCLISGNQTLGFRSSGGGIFNESANLTIIDSTVSNNRTQGNSSPGGGIFHEDGSLTLSNCTISGNSTSGSAGFGGGLFLNGLVFGGSGNEVLLTRCTFTGNSTGSSEGGAIFSFFDGVRIEHCTIVANSSRFGSAGLGLESFIPTETEISNSIIRDNDGRPDIEASPDSAAFEDEPMILPTITFSGNNIIGILGQNVTGITPNADPILLAPLANYGGPTETMPPRLGSPAIRTANITDTIPNFADQRGFGQRSLEDIGAVEFQGEQAELELALDTDGDQDGLSVGLELMLGTVPFITDFENPNRLKIGNNEAGELTLTFGRGSDFVPGSILILEQSETLESGSFEEAYRFIFDTSFGSASDVLIVTEGEDLFTIIDSTLPSKNFYRLRAILLPD